MRPHMFRAVDAGEAFALATILAADGGPRPAGSQMVVTETDCHGFLSGGCIEHDIALHAREMLRDGKTRRLVYGRGSPFIDIRLPCGGRIDVVLERIGPEDPAIADLRRLTAARRPAVWSGIGSSRQCRPGSGVTTVEEGEHVRLYDPPQQLLVAGSDPFALAMAGLGRALGWDTVLLSPFGPSADPPFDIVVDRRPLAVSIAAYGLDRWTAIAVATHDLDADEEALVPALQSEAGFVGVLGSRRKLEERRARLVSAGLNDAAIARLQAPIGLDIGARSPWEVGAAVIAQIIAHIRLENPCAGKSHATRLHA